MTKQELKDEAEKLGLRVKSAYTDDWLENVVWTACGLGVGWLLGRFL